MRLAAFLRLPAGAFYKHRPLLDEGRLGFRHRRAPLRTMACERLGEKHTSMKHECAFIAAYGVSNVRSEREWCVLQRACAVKSVLPEKSNSVQHASGAAQLEWSSVVCGVRTFLLVLLVGVGIAC